jgi:hypothetical protein
MGSSNAGDHHIWSRQGEHSGSNGDALGTHHELGKAVPALHFNRDRMLLGGVKNVGVAVLFNAHHLLGLNQLNAGECGAKGGCTKIECCHFEPRNLGLAVASGIEKTGNALFQVPFREEKSRGGHLG